MDPEQTITRIEPADGRRWLEPSGEPDHPACLVLPARAGSEPAGPTVRIFLGTEDRQARALRIFLYSVERHRDPDREYRIYLMKDLPGFDRRGWRTGFTLYRFAIPEFAGDGRAIYNDVDQIYTADPALLFDQPLGDAGYLAVSTRDTSVMLMDCARMRPHWNLGAARRGSKKSLTRAAAESGLWGALDGMWNARDTEYREGHSGLLHFTALHLQPWQPEPERYSYHGHPLAEVWLRLERAADAEGYQPFSESTPSPWYADACRALGGGSPPQPPLQHVREVLRGAEPGSDVLWCLPARAAGRIPDASLRCWRYGSEPPPETPQDIVVVSAVLEWLPAEDLPWVLDKLFRLARRLVHVHVTGPARNSGDGTPPPRHAAWWRRLLRRAAAAHPRVGWHLSLTRPGRFEPLHVHAEPRAAVDETPPRVWVLTGERHGDAEQVRSLARALGWPWEEKRLVYNAVHHVPNVLLRSSLASIDGRRSDPVEPPWPDLVIGSGKRSVPVARWIQRRSGGRTQLVFLGRPWAPLYWFDLVISTPQYGLPLRDNVHINTLPLNRPRPGLSEAAHAQWRRRFAELPQPWTGLLCGGATYPFRFDAEAAAELGRHASRQVRRVGGSLLVTTSPRTDPTVVSALFDAVDVPAHLHRWRAGDDDNPMPAYLSLCDHFIVTGDSASMVAEAVATGRRVDLHPLPARWPRLRGAGHALLRLVLGQDRRGHRGTPRQQNRRQRCYDRLVSVGLLQTVRDLSRLHELLIKRGLVRWLGDADSAETLPVTVPLPDETVISAARVRERLGERAWDVSSGQGRRSNTAGDSVERPEEAVQPTLQNR